MSVTLCPHGARGLMACPKCEKAAFKPKPTTKRRCRICGGNHGEEWHALGAYSKTVEEERDRAERERDEARAALSAEQAKGNWQGQHELEMPCVRERNLREQLEQATALLRETRSVVDTWLAIAEAHGLGARSLVTVAAHIDAFLAGQPAPAKVVDDAMASKVREQYEHLNATTSMSGDECMRAGQGDCAGGAGMSLLRRLLCRHRWVTTMANVEVESGSTDMLTVCSQHCPKCAAFKLEWIFPNKDLMERARKGKS